MKKIFIQFLFCLLIISKTGTSQCMMEQVPLNQRIRMTEYIIEGKVIKQQAFRQKGTHLICTSSLIEVAKKLKGDAAYGFVEVITEGGMLGDEILIIEPSLELRTGDMGIFTLNKVNAVPVFKESKGAYQVYASSQGFIRFTDENSACDVFTKYADIQNDLYDFIKRETGEAYVNLKLNDQSSFSQKNINVPGIASVFSFTPLSITAGTGSVLTINGVGFGTTQGPNFVEFPNADDGGITYIKPHSSQYVLWSDTQIKVIVPSVTTQSGTAGTGVFRVNIGGIPNLSGATLTIDYALRNAYVPAAGLIYPMQHADQNSGGYVFAYNTSFYANAPARAAFERALTTWRCATHINLQTATTTSALASALQDGTSLVTFGALPAGVLGQCYSYAASCGGGSSRFVFIKEIDLIYSSSPSSGTWQFGPGAPSASEYDFETGAIHELGHAHMLAHVINTSDFMHFAGQLGQQNRSLIINDMNAGNAVMTLNLTPVCLQPVMIPLTPGNCTVGNTTGATSVSIANTTNNACLGTAVTFSATPTNGGATPVYQWQVNGVNVGTNSNTYVTSALVNGDIITCILTSDLVSVTNNPVTSNSIVMAFGVPTISISMTAGTNPACPGASATFKAVAFNQGTTPTYQWKFNGTNTGSNSTTLLTGGAISYTISCVLTSNLSCASPTTVTSNSVAIVVNPSGSPSVSIALTSGSNPSCAGTGVTFSASPVFGGPGPSYQWQVNGSNAGTNSPSFSSTSLANNDIISCILTSNANCANPLTATSSGTTMIIDPSVTPSITEAIVSGTNTICAGTAVTFSATPTNGGATPVYQWQVNGVNAGTNSPTFLSSSLSNNDVVNCVLTSSANCANPLIAASSGTTMIVNPSVTPAITETIVAGTNTICSGTSVTFSAAETNGGSSPFYQWQINGNNAGTNSSTFISSSLVNGDVVTCVLTSGANCANPVTVASSGTTMIVDPVVTPSVTETIVSGTNTICPGTMVNFSAAEVNGGTAPSYQWQINGNNAGTNSPNFSSSSLTNNDVVNCVLTSNANCANPATASSSGTTMVVLPPFDLSVSLSGNTLTSNDLSSTYQWIDCSNGNTPIPGETNQTFTASPSGTLYAVILNNGFCSDTSSCFVINSTGITSSVTNNQVSVYPNPFSDKLQLTLSSFETGQTYEVSIYDALGKKVFGNRFNTASPEIDLLNVTAGIYFLKIITTGANYNFKISKE